LEQRWVVERAKAMARRKAERWATEKGVKRVEAQAGRWEQLKEKEWAWK
jgi:hypothetical protein